MTPHTPHTPAPHAAVSTAVAGVLKTYGRDRLELEFRLGHRGRGGTFVPGVPEVAWTRLKDALDRSATRQENKIGNAVFTEARERIAGDGSGAKLVIHASTTEETQKTRDAEPKAFLMHKKRVSDVDVDLGTWCCRASMSLEVVDTQQPHKQHHAAHFKYERHKRRWSYRYKCWSIDMTKVTSNLPHQLDNDGMSFEVEIELVDTSVFFTVPVAVLSEWGLQLARDMCALMKL